MENQEAQQIVRWGVIGLGKISRKFAHDLQLVEGGILAAVASRTLEKAEAFKSEFAAEHAFGSYQEMLESGTVDMVYIGTPHHLHAENSIACLQEGLGVLCEKPSTINAHQLQEVLQVAKVQNAYYMEALWTRFLPATEKLLELLEGGSMGKVLEVEAEFCFEAEKKLEGRLYNMSLGGGAILDIGIYPIFLAYLLLGVPDTIKAEGQLSETGSDQTCSMRFGYDKHRSAHLHASILYESKMPARINCERGTIMLDSRWHEAAGMTVIEAGKEVRRIEAPFKGKGFTHQIQSSQAAFRGGQNQNHLWTHLNSLEMMQIMDEVRSQVGVQYSGIDN